MPQPTEMTRFEHLIQQFSPGSRLLRAWALLGGVSAQVTALEILLPNGERQKLVVRQHGAADLAKNPNIARDEYRLLSILQAVGIPVPAPLYVEPSGSLFGTPVLVVAFVEGSTDALPDDLESLIRQFAAQLASIHRVQPIDSLAFLPNLNERAHRRLATRPERLDESLGESRIRAALENTLPFPQRNPLMLLHGDYWLGNILWLGDKIEAVIDWEDAALGDPLSDLAKSRLEILWSHGQAAMHAFTAAYLAQMPLDLASLPLWDLWAALSPAFQLSTWAASPEQERHMRELHAWFVQQAIAVLPST